MHSVEYVRGEFLLREGNPTPSSLAWGHFDDDILTDGWHKLYINTSNTHTDHKYSLLTHYAAGNESLILERFPGGGTNMVIDA